MIVNGKICKCQDHVFRLDEVAIIEPMRQELDYVTLRGKPVGPPRKYFRVVFSSGASIALWEEEDRPKLINAVEDYWREP